MNFKEKLLNAKPKITKVVIDEVGELYIRSLSCKQIEDLSKMDETHAGQQLICMGLCDEQGNDVFDFDENREELQSLQFHIMTELCEKIQENSLFSKKVEDAKKN